MDDAVKIYPGLQINDRFLLRVIGPDLHAYDLGGQQCTLRPWPEWCHEHGYTYIPDWTATLTGKKVAI